jgi:hypothetical protein
MIEEKFQNRIEKLITEGLPLTRTDEHGAALDERQISESRGWLTASAHVVHLVFGENNSAYRTQLVPLVAENRRWGTPGQVHEVVSILRYLLEDLRDGMIVSITDATRAETFDNFLDHGKDYLAQSQKPEAGVIVGVVFEDSVRRICDKQGIKQTDIKLDQLITELTKNGTFTQMKAKRARAAAHVRTKATHAQWKEFELSDVQSAVQFTEELILNHIES